MDNSPLQRLPGELRNRIFELVAHVYVDDVVPGLPVHVWISCPAEYLTVSSFLRQRTPFLRICKQIFIEHESAIYSANDFWFGSYGGSSNGTTKGFEIFERFTAAIGKNNAQALRYCHLALSPLNLNSGAYKEELLAVAKNMADLIRRYPNCVFDFEFDLCCDLTADEGQRVKIESKKLRNSWITMVAWQERKTDWCEENPFCFYSDSEQGLQVLRTGCIRLSEVWVELCDYRVESGEPGAAAEAELYRQELDEMVTENRLEWEQYLEDKKREQELFDEQLEQMVEESLDQMTALNLGV